MAELMTIFLGWTFKTSLMTTRFGKPEIPGRPNRLEFTSRLLAIFGLSLSVVLGLSSLYLYAHGKERRGLSYTIPHDTYAIYEAESATNHLLVRRSDSTLIDKNVYLSRIGIWNSGDLEIDPEQHVREPVQFVVSGIQEILDARVSAQTRRMIDWVNISNVAVVENDSTSWAVTLDWHFFDPGHRSGTAAIVDIVYVSDVPASISARATIIGLSKIDFVSHERHRPARSGIKMLIALMFLTSFALLYRYLADRLPLPKNQYGADMNTRNAAIWWFCLFLTGFILWQTYGVIYPDPTIPDLLK